MTSELRVDKIVPVDGVPTGGGGGIIQVVQTIKKDQFLKTSKLESLRKIKTPQNPKC